MTLLDFVKNGDIAGLMRLLETGQAIDRELNVALQAAVKSGQEMVVTALLGAGADPNAFAAEGGWGPLHLAVENEELACLAALFAAGGDANLSDRDGNTLLHLAVDIEADGAHQSNQAPVAELTKILLRCGADPTLKNAVGVTPIDIATNYHHEAAVAALGGAASAMNSNRGSTP